MSQSREYGPTGTPSTTTTARRRASGGGPGFADGRPGYLVMDVAGAYLPALGGWMPVAAMVTLMGQLGVDEQAVRSAIYRIAKRGLLVPERRDGVRGYRLSAAAEPLLDAADRRILSTQARARACVEDGWVLASFSVPEEERDKRHTLRSRLAWLGFGNLSNGLWIAPARVADELAESVQRLGFERYVTVFVADHRGYEPTADLVKRCWDLDGLRAMYADFLAHWEPVLGRWAHRPDAREAFVDYTLLLNHWRRFPYRDPGLPLALLPPAWEGQRAADVFFALRTELEAPAVQHARETAAP